MDATTKTLSVAYSCIGDGGGVVVAGRRRRTTEGMSSPQQVVWQAGAQDDLTTNGGNVGASHPATRIQVEDALVREGVEARSHRQSLCNDGESNLEGQRRTTCVVTTVEAEPFVVVVDSLGCIVFAIEG